MYCKWWHDTVYCISLEGIIYRVKCLYKQFYDGWKRLKAERETSVAAVKYKEFMDNKNKLFDIYPDDLKREKHFEGGWGVKKFIMKIRS